MRRIIRARKLLLALTLVIIAVLGNVVVTLAAAPTLLRRPYVQQVYTNSLIVAWTTTESGASEVRYGTSDFSQVAAATSTFYNTGESPPYDAYYLHQATLTGLSANTVYQYKIYTSGSDITPGGSINVRTAKSAAATSFRLAAFGDSGQGNQAQADVAAQLLAANPDVIVHTGDIVYNTSTYTGFEERYFQVYDDQIESVWLAPSPGNHDTDYNNGQSYVDVFINPENGASDPIEREMYYSFDYGNAHFSIVTPEVSYSSGSNQYDWLEADLAAASQYWKFVVFHVPPYFTSSSQSLSRPSSVASTLGPLFEQYDVDMVLSGDRHWYERFKPIKDGQLAAIEDGAVVYVITGGGGAGLGTIGSPPWHNFTAEKAREYHFTQIDINECQAHLSAIDSSGVVFDNYTLDRCEGPPIADFSADTQNGIAPLTVNFSDLSSRGPTSWSWDFGDGGSSTQQHPSHTYNTPGTYSVELTVSNSSGSDTLTMTNYIVVSAPPAPVAQFEANITNGFTPLTVNFTDLSQNNPTSWSWTFGDGSTSTQQNPSHTYNTAGTYTVSLTATNNNGSDGETKTGYIVVTNPPAPVADFSADKLSGQALLTVNFSDLTSNNPTSWSWTFGDGGTSTLQNPSHTYTVAGTYAVSLTASHSYGSDNETKPNYITVTKPTARFKTTSYQISETGSPEVTITVELTGPYGSPISVNYATSNGTAVAPGDYDARNGTLEFPANVTEKTFTVPIVDDNIPENAETINLTLSGPSASAPKSATITILDDDTPPVVRFNKAQYNVNENGGTADVVVELSYAYHTAITVVYNSADGTAVSGLDYTAVSNTLTFTPGGPTSKTISVPLVNNGTDEEQESFTVTLSNPTVAALGSPSTTTVTIADDDPAPNINFTTAVSSINEAAGNGNVTVALSAVSDRTVTVDYSSSNGSALAGEDYTNISGSLTFLPGETSHPIPFTILEDLLDEPEENFSIQLQNATNGNAGSPITINIQDNDLPPEINFVPVGYNVLENSGQATVFARLSSPSGQTVTANYAVTGGTATSGSDYSPIGGQISFAPGEVSSSFTVTPLDDDIEEGSETIEITLSSPQYASIGGGNVATVTILDNEGPPLFQFSAAAFSAVEGESFANLTVILSGSSSSSIEVGFSSAAGSAVPGEDYQEVNDVLTFAPGISSQDIQIPLLNNNTSEGDETFSVTLSNVSGGTPGTPLAAIVTISDDDPLPVANLENVPQNVNENDGNITITAQLSAASEQTVELEYTISPPATAIHVDRAADGKLTFLPGEVSKTFEVAIPNDSIDEPDQSLTVSLVNPINATIGPQGSAQIIVKDDDPPASIHFSAAQFTASEGAGVATIDVLLSAPSGHQVTVQVESADLTALAGSDYVAVSKTLTFNPGETVQSVAVVLLNDAVAEPGESLTLTLSAANQAILDAPGTATLTILDNDGNTIFLPVIN